MKNKADSFNQNIADLKCELKRDSSNFHEATNQLVQWVTNSNTLNGPFHQRFRKEGKSSLNSEFIPSFEAAVSADHISKRITAVVTLGRIGAIHSIQFLRTVFERSLENDPLLLHHLVGEISWLTDSTRLETFDISSAKSTFLFMRIA